MKVHGIELAATAGAAVLLLAFQSVVQQSVRQGEVRRVDTARQTEAWSDCNRLQGRAAVDLCRAGVV